MNATALLLVIIAVFLILNAGNFEQVLAGKLKIHLVNNGTPAEPASPTLNEPSAPSETI